MGKPTVFINKQNIGNWVEDPKYFSILVKKETPGCELTEEEKVVDKEEQAKLEEEINFLLKSYHLTK